MCHQLGLSFQIKFECLRSFRGLETPSLRKAHIIIFSHFDSKISYIVEVLLVWMMESALPDHPIDKKPLYLA